MKVNVPYMDPMGNQQKSPIHQKGYVWYVFKYVF